MELNAGLKSKFNHEISEHELATNWRNDVPVLATPVLLWLTELSCMKTIEQCELDTNQMTVGYAHEMKHLAATPMGHTINIESELVEVSGKKLIFKVVGYDLHDKVVEGYHTRFIIDKEKFLKNLAQKELVK